MLPHVLSARVRTRLVAVAFTCLLAACASTPTAGPSPLPSHAASSTDAAADRLTSPGAVADDHIVLVAHGMACPKCVTNADLQLMKLPGVAGVRIDMQHGILDMTMTGADRPTRAEIAKAIDDAGLTLVSVHGRTADEAGS